MQRIIIGITTVMVSIAAATAQNEVRAPTQSIADSKGCRMWDQAVPADASISWTGSCNQGYLDGKGTLQWFAAGKPTDRYDGEIKAGRYDGRGVYTWATGERYDGEFKDGYLHGNGVWTNANGDRYAGAYKLDLKSGRGVFAYANGNRYEGNFREGQRDGQGVFTWTNGSRYDGEWRDNMAHGRGVLRSAQGRLYSGLWTAGCFKEDGSRAAVGKALPQCP